MKVTAMKEKEKCFLGLELGSTRIKTVLLGEDHSVLSEGAYTWGDHLEEGYWSYDLSAVKEGVQDSFASCMMQARERGLGPEHICAIGISAMMHGYLAFDEKGELLVPFRTWRNTSTSEAATRLTELFHYNIPQRWSIAHLYQALLNGEDHVGRVRTLMTLAEYVHFQLTGEKVIGLGDASGMFPIDLKTLTFDQGMIERFNALPEVQKMPWQLTDLLPKPLPAGELAGRLTKEGAAFLDPTGSLPAGIPLCPPEGDAQTGMIATGTLRQRTGNVSAGTSSFAILVLEKELSKVYPEIDLVTSPSGKLVANVHTNNCTGDINAWAGVFKEFAASLGMKVSDAELYTLLFQKALEGDADGGGILSFNYYGGEQITGVSEGRPLFMRLPDASFTLANLMRTELYSSLATLRLGMDIILQDEGMHFDRILAHGGFFKTPEVGQRILAAVLDMPITVMETADQGGAWGIALLAKYMLEKDGLTLEDYLEEKVFAAEEGITITPRPEEVTGFKEYLSRYKAALPVEKQACECLKPAKK